MPGFVIAPSRLANAPITSRRTWVATSAAQDWASYALPGSAFVVSQSPWGAYDMGAGDVFNCEVFASNTGFIRMRTITGPLRLGGGLPKGNPNITFNDHFDLRPSVRPFGDGIWSNTISELKASISGTATGTGGFARALQIHGFRTAYTGSAWTEYSSTDGETYDIQMRYKTSGGFPRYVIGAVPSDVFMERRQLGPHTWDIFRTNGGWTSDLGMGLQLVDDAENLSNVDIKAILDYVLADANVRYSRSDTGIYIRGVQTWIEPRDGTIDATMESMSVTYNGTVY